MPADRKDCFTLESRTLLTAGTSSTVRHFPGHDSDSNDGTSVAVDMSVADDTARVNLSSVVSDAIINSGRSITRAPYLCIVARGSMRFPLHLPCAAMWLSFHPPMWVS